MTDAMFQAAGYGILTEDVPNQKITSTRKTYTPVAYGSKTKTPSRTKVSIYADEFSALYLAFRKVGHFCSGNNKSNHQNDGRRISKTVLPEQYDSTIMNEPI